MDYAAVKAANKALNSEEARQGLTRLKSRPIFFWFDLYGPCNLKCLHCGYRKVGRTSDSEVSETIYSEIIRELMPSAYTCNLGGTNWGEMTISKNFQRFLLDCKAHDVKVNLTTNGTRMNDQWTDTLAEVAEVVGFSMEGIESEFEKIRGFPWKRFVDNIEKLVDARRRLGRTFRIEWRYCAHSDSIHQLPDMIRLAKRLGLERIQVMPLMPYVAEQKFKNLAYHRSLANQYFELGRAVAKELDFTINIPRNYGTGEFGETEIGAARQTTGAAAKAVELVNCFRPWQTCSINELGSVKPCCFYWRPMGEMADGGFERVWNGRNYRALRRSINHRSDSICYDCRLPAFEAEAGRTAAELKPSPKQFAKQLVDAALHPVPVTFRGVLDADLDPRPAKDT